MQHVLEKRGSKKTPFDDLTLKLRYTIISKKWYLAKNLIRTIRAKLSYGGCAFAVGW